MQHKQAPAAILIPGPGKDWVCAAFPLPAAAAVAASLPVWVSSVLHHLSVANGSSWDGDGCARTASCTDGAAALATGSRFSAS
uniref:Uncharacterized protein n=1 Tax=Anopheles dirus TaxID=7168 RepID=A0A182NXK5_9DIPT